MKRTSQAEQSKEKPSSRGKKVRLKRETIKDLDPKGRGADVKAGEPATMYRTGCDS